MVAESTVRFQGNLQVQDDPRNWIRAVMVLHPSKIDLTSGDQSLGSWPLSQVAASRLEGDRFQLTLGEETAVFAADDALGFSYEGRCFCSVGTTERALGAGRDGVFGNDGSTRANLGIVNQGDASGTGSTDARITYFEGSTGALLRQFFLSNVIGHDLEANEVAQLNNIFNDPSIPASTNSLVIKVEATRANWYISAYIVQLDNTTQDGSFFYLFEE